MAKDTNPGASHYDCQKSILLSRTALTTSGHLGARAAVRSGASNRTLLRVFVGLLALLLSSPGKSVAQEFSIVPSLTLREEYNDNIFLEPADEKQEYITQAIPNLKLHYKTRFWSWDADYSLDYRHFERRTVKDDIVNTLSLQNHTEVVKNLFFVDAGDRIDRVSLDLTRDYTQQSAVVNQAEQNLFNLNAYLRLKPSGTTLITVGHNYRDTRYWNIPANSVFTAIDRTDAITYAEATKDLTSRLTITAAIRYTLDRNSAENFDRLEYSAGPRYIYAEKSFISVEAGENLIHYASGRDSKHMIGKAVVSHTLSPFTLRVEGAVLYAEDPQRILTKEDIARATVQYDSLRTTLALATGSTAYREAGDNELFMTSHDVQGTMTYKLTPRTMSMLNAQYQDLRNNILDANIRTQLYGLRIEHRLGETLTMAIEARVVYGNSPTSGVFWYNNYTSDRALIEFRKIF